MVNWINSKDKSHKTSGNYQAFYFSSSSTGDYRDSMGYKMLLEQAYAAQRREYVQKKPTNQDYANKNL